MLKEKAGNTERQRVVRARRKLLEASSDSDGGLFWGTSDAEADAEKQRVQGAKQALDHRLKQAQAQQRQARPPTHLSIMSTTVLSNSSLHPPFFVEGVLLPIHLCRAMQLWVRR